MVSLTCTTDARDGVTLVTARLAGGGVTQRVRVANRLDGPVWPPRRQGVPEAGWDDDGFTGVVPAGETVALGYASPAPPAESPLEITDREVVDADGDDPTAESPNAEPTPAGAVRELGDPAPPRDAVPVPVGDAANPAENGEEGTPSSREPTGDTMNGDDALPRPATGHATRAESPVGSAAPEPIAAWFGEVERRLDRAEALAEAGTVPAATDALRAVGGLDEAADLAETVEADADALAAVADRAATLADRAEAIDVPIETFRQIA